MLCVTLPKSCGFGEGWGRARIEVSTMPPRRSTPKILHQAGELRKETTPAEKKLWAYLRLMRKDGIRFRRQHAIGNYIADFCAPRKKLVIELDGTARGGIQPPSGDR